MTDNFKAGFLVILLSLLPVAAFPSDKDIKMQLFDATTKTYKTISVTKKNNMLVSTDCLKKTKTLCLAAQAVNEKVALPSSPTGVIGNPAARYCLAQSANNRILLDEKKKEYDYCVFSDGSMIDAWSLFNKHYGS